MLVNLWREYFLLSNLKIEVYFSTDAKKSKNEGWPLWQGNETITIFVLPIKIKKLV